MFILVFKGLVMAQAVYRWPIIAEAWVRSDVVPGRNMVEKDNLWWRKWQWDGFHLPLTTMGFGLVSIIPPILRSHLYLYHRSYMRSVCCT